MDTGKSAQTRYRIFERLRGATLLELEPVTGRTNQLRIHCAHIGHPIVGDDVYSGLQTSDCGLKDEQDQGQAGESALYSPQHAIRLCLHAWKLGFHHPAGGDWMEFIAPVPDEFNAVIRQFRPICPETSGLTSSSP